MTPQRGWRERPCLLENLLDLNTFITDYHTALLTATLPLYTHRITHTPLEVALGSHINVSQSLRLALRDSVGSQGSWWEGVPPPLSLHSAGGRK